MRGGCFFVLPGCNRIGTLGSDDIQTRQSGGTVSGNSQSTPRVAAIVGPYLSGKTSLMESLLFVAGALPRKGSVKEGNTVGDASMEAKARQMSVEASLAACTYQGEAWTLIDCPGSVEFSQIGRAHV